MKKKICVFTGSRAEYGLLKPLIKQIEEEEEFQLQLIVSGMHLSTEFGLTYKEIEEDRFIINEKVEILLSSDSPVGISKSIGLGLIGFCEALARLEPDCIIILGDRFEALACAIASTIARIPIVHLYGGEVTEGAIDEVFRHSITKMSHLHFTSTEEYRKRVIQLGENPEKVFNVGALGIDNINNMILLSKKYLEKELQFRFNKRNLLVTMHPTTIEKNTSKKQFNILLEVLKEQKETHFFFTKANADTDGRVINQLIDDFVREYSSKAVSFISMGQVKYLSTMQFVDALVGNSSSGIIEAPSFKIGTINIGDRQKGRIKSKSVIDCKPINEDIKNAMKKLYSKAFQKSLNSVINPYGDGNTTKRIKDVLKKYNIENILKKSFYDLDFKHRSNVCY